MSDRLHPIHSGSASEDKCMVRHFRQILLWPLQLEVEPAQNGAANPWDILTQGDTPWSKVERDIAHESREAKERHYKEFVTFLPYVQRFLYGEGRSQRPRLDGVPSDSPMQVFRRRDVQALRITLRLGDTPVLLHVDHVDLHFFFDIDVVFLKVEVHAEDVPWHTTLELLHRFGRAYPSGWDDTGSGVHNAHQVEWLGQGSEVLAVSDSEERDKFLSFVCQHRTPAIASHWAFLLQPLALEHADETGTMRYRQLEYHRMPVMAYLAMEDPRSLSQDDFVRLGFITAFRPGDPLPYRDPSVAEFEHRYCDDRYWTDTDTGPNTRVLCTGNTLIVIGEARSDYFRHEVYGIHAQFRRQFMLLFLIAHFHRASLLVFSDRMVDAVNDLDIRDIRSQLLFRKRVRDTFEAFLRFTHRYWVHELSERPQVQGLFQRCAVNLGNGAKYLEVKEEIRDMSQYLESDTQRRQSNTVVRLTVVTTFGLIGTAATSFLGMNLLAAADAPLAQKLVYFVIVLLVTTLLTLFTVAKSKPLSNFLERLAEGRL